MQATVHTVSALVSGGELVAVHSEGRKSRYFWNTHRISRAEFDRIASLKGVCAA